MNKAFIFDLDGIIIDNELMWEEAKKEIYTTLFGEEIYSKMGHTMGMDMPSIYRRAVELGANVSLQSMLDEFYRHALNIYAKAPITKGVKRLADSLVKDGYSIGLVSTSPMDWINRVINRLSFKEKITVIISLEDSPELQKKPEPDGYLKAMKDLKVAPSSTIILEDSNSGIAAAKASGAFTIAFTQNLVHDYKQIVADAKAANMEEVMKIMKNHSLKS